MQIELFYVTELLPLSIFGKLKSHLLCKAFSNTIPMSSKAECSFWISNCQCYFSVQWRLKFVPLLEHEIRFQLSAIKSQFFISLLTCTINIDTTATPLNNQIKICFHVIAILLQFASHRRKPEISRDHSNFTKWTNMKLHILHDKIFQITVI